MKHITQGFMTNVISINEHEHSMYVHLEPGTSSEAKILRNNTNVPEVILNVRFVPEDLASVEVLTVFIPWELANVISTAYEHELAGLAHEASQ